MANKHEKAPGSRQGFRWYLTVLAQNFPDWVGLNFVFLLTCLPIFTLGPALSAMGYVMEQLAKDAPVKLLRAYCSTFRSRFLSKMAWGLLFWSLSTLLFTAVWYYFALGGALMALAGLGMAGLILLWSVGLHSSPPSPGRSRLWPPCGGPGWTSSPLCPGAFWLSSWPRVFWPFRSYSSPPYSLLLSP